MTPYDAYNLCKKKKKRIKKYEPFILEDAYYSYTYALFIIKGRWPEAESIILTDCFYSFYYALNVMKKRWPEAEPIIQSYICYWKLYSSYFNIKKEKHNWKLGL